MMIITNKPEDTGQKIIAITGTIGSGKTAVGDIAARHGAFIVDTDYLAKELQAEGTEASALIKSAFGAKYYEGGFLNRRALGQEVFSNPVSLKKLNAIMHPLIYGAMLKMFGIAGDMGYRLICALVPLLFEAGGEWLDCFDGIWLVAADEELCIKRIMERDKCAAAYAKARIASQMPLAEKLEAAEKINIPVTVIENDGSASKLNKQVVKALKPYKKILSLQLKQHIMPENE